MNAHEPAGLLLRFVAGMLLLWGGLVIIPSGSNESAGSVPVSVESVEEAQSPTSPNPEKPVGYRLAFDAEQGYWTTTALGGSPVLLTDIVPGPRKTRVPGDFLTPAEVKDVLQAVLDEWALKLSEEERETLLGLKLGDIALFRAADLGLAAVKTDLPDPPAATISRDGPWNWELPAGINPSSAEFAAQMAVWRKGLLPLLRATRRSKRAENLNVSFGERMVRLRLSAKTRKIIAREDFGANPRDAAIYLQFLACARGADLAVDGAFGPGSRAAWRALLVKQGIEPDSLDGYMGFLEGYFKGGVPPLFKVDSEAFRANLLAWRSWIQPYLSGKNIEYRPTFQGTTVRLEITAPARARLLATNFGAQRRDEVIYLQFLANHHGTTMTVDGLLGPASKENLERVVRANFRRKPGVLQALLSTRYP